MKSTSILIYIFMLGFSFASQAKSNKEQPIATENVTSQELLIEEKKPSDNRVDEIQDVIDTMMQDTASWLDNIVDNNSGTNSKKASARGYVQLGWMPRTADWSELDPKFKVRLSLPRWNDKLSLVFDNDDEDEIKLDYEASSIDQGSETDEFNIAMQYVKKINDSLNVKYKAGISKDQLFVRSEIKRRWITDKYHVGIVPRLDYFHRNGWAPSIKGIFTVPMNDNLISFSTSLQKFEKEKYSRKKIGLYYISHNSAKKELVSGIQYFNNEYSKETFLVSIRQRNLLYKNWFFLEFEPFLEFEQENDYRREFGLAIRLIAYYGAN